MDILKSIFGDLWVQHNMYLLKSIFEELSLVEGFVSRKPRPWSDLPIDIVRSIFEELSPLDRFRARVACKIWSIPPLLDEFKNKELPWIMTFTKIDGKSYEESSNVMNTTSYQLYDPSNKKKIPYRIFKEDHDHPLTSNHNSNAFRVIICASKRDWVMFYRKKHDFHRGSIDTCSSIFPFVYNPFTKHTITLPELKMSNRRVRLATFSSPPTTSQDCVFFVLIDDCKGLEMNTYCCGDKKWNTCRYEFDGNGSYLTFVDAVYVDGTFYCVSSTGTLAGYSVALQTWTFLTEFNPLPQQKVWTPAYLVESNRELLLVFVNESGCEIYIFDMSNTKAWVKKEEGLKDRALFLGLCSSYSVSAIDRDDIANNVYYHDYSALTKLYTFKRKKTGIFQYQLGSQIYNWVPKDRWRIWIQPPNI